MTTPFVSSWAPYRKPPTDSRHKPKFVKLNFFPNIKKYGQLKLEKLAGIPTIGMFDKPKFVKVSHTQTLSDDNMNFEMSSWPPPVYKYDKSIFEKLSGPHAISKYNKMNFKIEKDNPKTNLYDRSKLENVIDPHSILKFNKLKFEGARDYLTKDNYYKSKFEKVDYPHSRTIYNKLKFKGARDYPKNSNYDKSKFEKVSDSIYFVKDLDMRPQARFDLNELKCHNRNRNGLCVSYVQNKQNIATVAPVKNNDGDMLRTPFASDSEEANGNYYNDDISNESLEDLTRNDRIRKRAHGNVSEDYIDVSNKLLIREQSDVKPEFKFDHEQQKQLLIELENALRKPPVIIARKSLAHKKRRKKKIMKKQKKTDLNITFTPLKYYRAVKSDESDSDEDSSDSDEENVETVTITIVKTGTIKIIAASDESIDEPLIVTKKPILKKAKKKKRNRFSVIDNEKNKAKNKKNFKAKNDSNESKNKDSAEPGENKNEPYEYKSDESYGSSEKLSNETHVENTTLKSKKKKKKKSKVYMYMQGPQRQYTDSEEGSRRYVKKLSHRVDNNKNNALRNNDNNSHSIGKKRVSEDYIDYANYRRTIPMFLPKRYFWKKDQLLDLGYFWFNGPQGHTPGPYQINY